jgi:hypothetical protein
MRSQWGDMKFAWFSGLLCGGLLAGCRTIYFCCEGCLQSARRSPQRFIKPTLAEQEQAVKAYLAQSPEAPKGEEFCTE